MRYLRRDEDLPGTSAPVLLRRLARELHRDLRLAGRDWAPATARALRRLVLEYHLRMASGRLGSDPAGAGRMRSLPLRAGDVRLEALVRPTVSDLFVVREIFVHQLYRYPYDLGGPIRRVLDLGSNAGMSPLYYSLRHPDAEVVCVEPVAANVELLRRQRSRNRLRWTIEPVAVAARSGETTLYPNGWSASSSTTPRVVRARQALAHRPEGRLARPPVTVPAVTVDDLLDRAGWDRVDVVKMDVEGAEESILLDVEPGWLHRVGTLALDIHDKYVSRSSIVARLADHGFHPAARDGSHSAIFVRAGAAPGREEAVRNGVG